MCCKSTILTFIYDLIIFFLFLFFISLLFFLLNGGHEKWKEKGKNEGCVMVVVDLPVIYCRLMQMLTEMNGEGRGTECGREGRKEDGRE